MVSLSTVLEVSRPGWWIVNVWLYVAPTGQQWDLLYSFRFWFGLLYALFPLSLLIFGLNDYCDVQIDKDNPRKGNFLFGAKCTKAQLAEIVKITTVLNAFCMLVLVALSDSPLTLTIMLLFCTFVNIAYNCEPLRFSSKSPLEFPCVIIGYAGVSVLSCYINNLPLSPVKYWIHVALIIVRSQLWTEYMDLDADAAQQRRTTAVILGREGIRLASTIAIIVESVIVCYLFDDFVVCALSLAALVFFLGTEVVLPMARGGSVSKKDKPAMRPQKKHIFYQVALNIVAFIVMVLVWMRGAFL